MNLYVANIKSRVAGAAAFLLAGTVPFGAAAQNTLRTDSLRYNLSFVIPHSLQERVAAKAEIVISTSSADRNAGKSLVFSFAVPATDVKSVTLNGKSFAKPNAKGLITLTADALTGNDTLRAEYFVANETLNRYENGYFFLSHKTDSPSPKNTRKTSPNASPKTSGTETGGTNLAPSLYPCVLRPDQKAVYQVTLTQPNNMHAFTNTANQNKTVDKAADTKTITFKPTSPLANDKFAIAGQRCGIYANKKTAHNIRLFHPLKEKAHTAQLDTIVKTIDFAMDYMERATGVRYPFPKFEIMVMPEGVDYAAGWDAVTAPGCVFMKQNDIVLDGQGKTAEEAAEARTRRLCRAVVYMWLGAYITVLPQRDGGAAQTQHERVADELTTRVLECLTPKSAADRFLRIVGKRPFGCVRADELE